MNKIIFIISLALLSSPFALAEDHSEHKNHKDHQHQDEKHNHKDAKASSKMIAKDKILIKVTGMVCSFCAQGIKKNFNARDEVKKTDVDLDKMEVTLHLKKGKSLSEEVIKTVVTDAGFDYVGVVE